MTRVLAALAFLFAALVPAAALDFPQLSGRVVDEARLFDADARRGLENRLANLEAHTGKQLMVVTLASARGMTVDDYGLELRKHWGLETNGRRAMLIVAPHDGRSVIQFDNALNATLTEPFNKGVLDSTMVPRFNAGDFPGGVQQGADALIRELQRASPTPLRVAESGEAAVPATSEYPALTGRVVDAAGELDAATREALRAKLAAFEARTSHQLVVATVKSLNGNSVEEYANRLFRRWQLGQRGKNNGVLLLHAPAERKIRIEVGYGLEGTLTDAITKFIIQNAIAPRFKTNDFAGGMTRGVDDIIKVLDGGAEEFRQRVTPHTPPAWLSLLEKGWPLLFFLGFGIVGYMMHKAERLSRKGSRRGGYAYAGSSSADSWSSSSSSSSWSSSSSSSSSSDSFSGGGGDSGGGGSSGDY
jgi:uncharacterized protein